MLASGAGGPGGDSPVAGKTEPAREAPVALGGFDEVVAFLTSHGELILAGEVETYLRPAAFEPGRIVCAVKEGAPSDILRRLSLALEEGTGQDWRVDTAEASGETIKERAARIHEEKVADAAAHPMIAAALEAMPGAAIVEVRQEGPLDKDDEGANVLPLTPKRA